MGNQHAWPLVPIVSYAVAGDSSQRLLRLPQTTVSLLGTACPRHTCHRHVLADGSQGHLELDGTLRLCFCDHGLHVGKEQAILSPVQIQGEESQALNSSYAGRALKLHICSEPEAATHRAPVWPCALGLGLITTRTPYESI